MGKKKENSNYLVWFFFFLSDVLLLPCIQGKGNKYNAAHRRRGVSGSGRGARKRNAERKELEDEWHFESTENKPRLD